ncbi:MBL fold metallo-hydrolase [Streptomyces canus]|uniref:Glyoxylase-like metal-dependent hydrolase (Beta-lactamase superfamily II) n=1 Tax=Streptomyces canus TaxID=58343 RepID=A0AAW8FNG1_9ACTN|nr:MBL fold metallo-hydrolase [Streptomyces canus]MDQ0760739.1 glyoxylase-like metal-dependent hydrolase (beta-lactamase superfamily II) [Streptomyces canus]MDQ0910612.1 glyoxylase-like metal-dependent hydrolase (beta-lactamase superfamily II) [Streptomyces canus]
MTVTWEELGWERVATGVGRCRLPGWDCTAGLVIGEGTALLIDSGSGLAEGARLRAQAEELAGHRVTHLALTHPHFDHVFGAAAFAGAEVFGAVGAETVLRGRLGRAELRADAVRNGLDPAMADEAVDALVSPRHHVCGEWTLDLGGGRQVLLANVGPGHTAHDLAVLVPGSPEVVFCGDLVEESGEPQAGPDAVPPHWPAALDRLLELGGEDALYVPGHGAVVDAAFVRAQRDALAARFGVSS